TSTHSCDLAYNRLAGFRVMVCFLRDNEENRRRRASAANTCSVPNGGWLQRAVIKRQRDRGGGLVLSTIVDPQLNSGDTGRAVDKLGIDHRHRDRALQGR